MKEIDPLIEPLIQELNRAGLKTLYSCQGHRKIDAYVVLDMTSINNIIVDKKTVSIYFDPIKEERDV